MAFEDGSHEHNVLARASLDHCVKCTICESQCPVMAVTPLFAGPKYVGPQAERYRHGQSVDHTLDYCSSCGTCSLVCPQGVKVAELNSVARAAMKKDHMPLRDQIISRTTLMGAVMHPIAPVANFALGVRPLRVIIEGVIGIHRDAAMPKAQTQTFTGWWNKHTPPAGAGQRGTLIYFHGCAGNYFEVETSIRTVEVLEYLGYAVLVPKQGCCGLPLQSNGIFDTARTWVRRLVDQLGTAPKDLTIVASGTSCSGMLKHEAREILGVQDESLKTIGERTRDICEFLLDLADKGELPLDFTPQNLAVAYHAPCQLRGHGMGTPAVQLLGLIPGVEIVESGAACCGMAGTYGLKKEKYEVGMGVGRQVFDTVKATNRELAICDSETCRWQIEKATGAKTVHPIWLLHKAYGLS
jgi:glycerol-3-phosphate dehydrogenase subunit C